MLLEHFRIDYHGADGHAVLPHRNVQPPIYEVRRKPLCFRGFPPNSLSFNFVGYPSIAACAAARRAIGTRKGEQDA